MTVLRLALRSLAYHGRMNLAVALGVAAATAVLTGALLVGDSMRGSLRGLTLERLGRIDAALATDRFFRRELADELAAEPGFQQHFAEAVPAILVRASLENPQLDPPRRANQVNLIGCDERFWRLGSGSPKELPGAREIVLNQPVADLLGAKAGDRVMLRLEQPGTIPADSPLGRRQETLSSSRLKVCEVIAAEGLGRFSLRSSQHDPRNVYVPLQWLAERLDRPGRANTLLVAGDRVRTRPPQLSADDWRNILRPKPVDYGLRVEDTPQGYINITSERMLLDAATEAELVRALGDRRVQPALTYLANWIACGEGPGRPKNSVPLHDARSSDAANRHRGEPASDASPRPKIPYSTVAALDFEDNPPLGPFVSIDGRPIEPLADDQIVLNQWAAEQLDAEVGDTVVLTYFEPESDRGQLRENTVELTLAAVTPLAGAAADPQFTPQVAGVTDVETMADWNPPFPFEAGRIRPADEQYWDEHRATPKAFVSRGLGQRLWGSRFGRATSLRAAPEPGETADGLGRALQLDPAGMGFAFQPVKAQGLAASEGTTPFNVLFLSFSSFIIASAVLLVALLFRLGIEQRASQLGTLVALGLSRRQVRRILALEGLAIAVGGSLLGLAGGLGYAALMLVGLQTWWLAAIVTPFLRMHAAPASLAIGFLAGLVVAYGAIRWAVWRSGRAAPRTLLAGRIAEALPPARSVPHSGGRWGWAAAVALVVVPVAGLLAARIGEEMQAAAFFGAGAVVLAVSVLVVWWRFRAGATRAAVAPGRGNLARLALRNAARNPGRSSLTIALVAAACFLIVAVSAFHLDPTLGTPSLHSGDGGFALVAESDQPLYFDPGTPEGRSELGLGREVSETLARTTILPLRVHAGDDASCLNLYQPAQPRLVGVSQAMGQRGGFAWAGIAEDASPQEKENPWRLLLRQPTVDNDGVPRVPVVVERNTAVYSLHLGGNPGSTYTIRDGGGRPLRLEVVGLLTGSIFQGDMLVGERALLRFFPEVSGYRLFLVETPPDTADEVQRTLESSLGDFGLAVETSGGRLTRFLAVQNTYLSTFQSLGGLGLVLGTIGLAVVQLRNVLERRGELALLRATGFRRGMLARLILLENALLLLTGLGCGVLAAILAILPHLLRRAASIPLGWLGATLGLVLVVGLLASLAAVRAAAGTPLLSALKDER